MISYTTNQLSAIAEEHQAVVQAVKIGLSSPLYYCEGIEPVTLGSDTFIPHEINVGNIRLGDPLRSTARLRVLDLEGTLATTWLTEGYSDVTVTLYEAVFHDGAWVTTRTLPWTCTTVRRSPRGFLELALVGGAGIRARGGLETATRADWRYAPQPGEAAKVGLVLIQA